MSANRILSEIARTGGGKLLNTAVSKALPPEGKEARKTILGGIAGAVAVRIATRSVPGAIIVTGAAIAKKLYDRRHAKGKDPSKA